MKPRSSFVLYSDNAAQVGLLTDAQAGQLFKALMQYAATGEEPELKDGMLRLAFSFMSAQIRRDAEKYEETCKARSESGKKGGAPVGNRNAAKKQPKQAKQPDTDTVCDTVPESEPETDPETESETVCVPAQAPHTAHTPKQKNAPQKERGAVTPEEILAIAREKGYVWTQEEAERFLAYNRDRGRTDGWAYAVERWEEQKSHHPDSSPQSPQPLTSREEQKMAKYLSLMNRFPKG